MDVNRDIGLRIQRMDMSRQVLVLAHIAAGRSEERTAAPAAVVALFHDLGLPAPAKIGNVFGRLAAKGLIAKGRARGIYKITPLGAETIRGQISDLDAVALANETSRTHAPVLGSAMHALVPTSLAPPTLIGPLREFLDAHPFDRNIFGMTRFPDAKAGSNDPVGKALGVAKSVCAKYGLEFHLASDRAITDDLWANVTAHMWASRYGVAFFEDRVERGVNHNLLIEVGAMVMTGRRCALLKDGSIDKMPTDLVGMIYKSVDLADSNAVADSLASWIESDLALKSSL